MSLSRPPSTESLDEGWALFEEEPAPDSDQETRTAQRGSPFFKALALAEEKSSSDERDTVPPPVPVSEYVQTMMQQPEEPAPLSLPFSWAGAMPPSSRRAAAFPPSSRRPEAFPPSSRRPDLPPPSERVTVASMRAAALPLPPAEDHDVDSGGFTLVAFEPERLGDAPAGVEAARFDDELTLSPDFDDLPFEHGASVSERSAAAARFPTPVPVFPSSRAEPPASIPPILDMAWATSAARHDEAPRTSRGVAAPRPSTRPERPRSEFPRFGSLDLDAPPSSRPVPYAPSPAPPPARVDPFAEARDLYDAGDFRSALVMAEAVLVADPDHAEARSYAASCRETLLKKYLGRLGGLAKIPRVAMPPDEIRWLSLDHKAGFLLACIDGTSTIEEVLDVSCMQEFEAIRILHDFRELGVIEILPGPRPPRR